MVQINELRITENGKLLIDANVKISSGEVYITDVYIDTQDTYTDAGPSSKAAHASISSKSQIRLEYTKNDLILMGADKTISLNKTLFFVYIKVTGTPSIDTPCGEDNVYTLGVTFDCCGLYNSFMNYIREINETCVVPRHFIDTFLKFKALEVSINTAHYPQAIKYYNKFIKDLNTPITTYKTCNCNG